MFGFPLMKVALLTSLSSVISVIVDSTGLDKATSALINETEVFISVMMAMDILFVIVL